MKPASLNYIKFANTLRTHKPESEYKFYSQFVPVDDFITAIKIWSFSIHESHGSNVKQYTNCKLHFMQF